MDKGKIIIVGVGVGIIALVGAFEVLTRSDITDTSATITEKFSVAGVEGVQGVGIVIDNPKNVSQLDKLFTVNTVMTTEPETTNRDGENQSENTGEHQTISFNGNEVKVFYAAPDGFAPSELSLPYSGSLTYPPEESANVDERLIQYMLQQGIATYEIIHI